MMGYPKCCIKNYIQFVERYGYTSDLDEKLCYHSIDDDTLCPLLGTEQKLFVHFPCSKKCEETLKINEKVLAWILDHDIDITQEKFF